MEKEIDRILNKVKTELNFSPESRYNFKSDNDFDKYHKSFMFLKTKGFIELGKNGYEITELGLSKKMLKEYPKTKWIARISIIIGISLTILEIIKAIGLLD